MGPLVAQQMLERISQDQPAAAGELASLTNREMEVFEMVGRGAGTAESAGGLGVSIKTVETYRSNIKTKPHLKNATALIRYATSWTEHV